MVHFRHEKSTQQDRNSKRFDGADLNYRHPYTRENPLPTTREHAHSWQLAGFDALGLPATRAAASEVSSGEMEEWEWEWEVLVCAMRLPVLSRRDVMCILLLLLLLLLLLHALLSNALD
jgi:hypothetical protein